MADPASKGRSSSRRWLRLIAFLVPSVAFLGLLSFALSEQRGPASPGEGAPDFAAPFLQGEGSLELSELEGKPVFLNFWWSGCEPCKDEAPLLARASRMYEDEIVFVGVNIRDSRDDAIAFVDEYDLDYQHVRDESLDIYDDYGLTGQPESFFIDDEGVVVEHIPGALSEESLFELLDILVRRSG